jgi:hypothetical protein
MKSFKTFFSENLTYHLMENIPINENVFRYGSEEFFNVIKEARGNIDTIPFTEEELDFLGTDIGSFGLYEGVEVPLDLPLIESDQNVKLNKPKRGGPKKFYVYVKNKNGNIIKVNFGDSSGLSAKINNPKARKAFVARHKCSQKKDKTTASYWSCRLPRYAKALGLSSGGNFFW